MSDRMTFLEHLTTEFAALAEREQPAGGRRRRRRPSPGWWSGPRAPAVAVAAIALIAAVAVAGGVWSTSGGRQAPRPPAASLGFPMTPVGQNPFRDGSPPIALSAAAAAAGFAIPAPDSSLANPGSLSDVWFDSEGVDGGTTAHFVDVDYVATDIRIAYRLADSALIADPAAAFTREIESVGGPASAVQTVHGVPALVVPASGDQNGFVELVLGHTDIAIMGYQPIAQMIAIAESMPGPQAG